MGEERVGVGREKGVGREEEGKGKGEGGKGGREGGKGEDSAPINSYRSVETKCLDTISLAV